MILQYLLKQEECNDTMYLNERSLKEEMPENRCYTSPSTIL